MVEINENLISNVAFNAVRDYVMDYKRKYNLKSGSNAFYYFVLGKKYLMQEDEIEESVTDNFFLDKETDKSAGHDRGIDIVYIDESKKNPVVNLVNCKYTNKITKKDNNFPSAELSDIRLVLKAIVSEDIASLGNINNTLKTKLNEIISLRNNYKIKLNVVLCSNMSKGLEETEYNTFKDNIKNDADAVVEEVTLAELSKHVITEDKYSIDARIKFEDGTYIEKFDQDINAIIADVKATDILRIVMNNSNVRNDIHHFDNSDLTTYEIDENAFDKNVRLFINKNSQINTTIEKTAMGEENYRFFYYNNGITIICSDIVYNTGGSIITNLIDLQVVNGCQTLHSIFKAYLVDPKKFRKMNLLVKFFKVENEVLTGKICEFTNTQTKVVNRDLKSNDWIQLFLEKQLKLKGYYYERKKDMYLSENNAVTIDSEKLGQILLAFDNGMPGSAKNKKKIVFGSEYDTIFHNDLSVNSVLLPYQLYVYIEQKRKEVMKNNRGKEMCISDVVVRYYSYYILYIMKLYSIKNNIEYSEIEKVKSFYDSSLSILHKGLKNQLEIQDLANADVVEVINTAKYDILAKSIERNWI